MEPLEKQTLKQVNSSKNEFKLPKSPTHKLFTSVPDIRDLLFKKKNTIDYHQFDKN